MAQQRLLQGVAEFLDDFYAKRGFWSDSFCSPEQRFTLETVERWAEEEHRRANSPPSRM